MNHTRKPHEYLEIDNSTAGELLGDVCWSDSQQRCSVELASRHQTLHMQSSNDEVEMTKYSAMETAVIAIAKARFARVVCGKHNAVGLPSDAE